MPHAAPRYRPSVRAVRDSAHERGYDAAWNATRKAVLDDVLGEVYPEGGALCRDCLLLGRFVTATDVDHKVPFRGDDDPLKFDPANLRSLCHSHHSQKTARFNR